MRLKIGARLKDFRRSESFNNLAFIIPFILPLLLIFLVNHGSFILGWNEGQGGLSFIILFLLIEWFDSRKKLEFDKSNRNKIAKLACLSGILFYFAFMYLFGYYTVLESFGEGFNIPGTLSWARMWDYIIYISFVAAMISLSFNDIKALKLFPTPIVYAIGMALILLLDSALPHSQLGIFEGVVSVIIFMVVSMLRYLGVGINILDEQTILVFGQKGTLRISLFWPCVGILSMLIYFLVIAILMLKLDISIYRKVLYAILGAIGTFFINVIRIFLIIYYGAFVSINLRMFHETIGEVLFVIWIIFFILIVTEWEGRRRSAILVAKN